MTGETLSFIYGAAGRWLTYLSVFALVGIAGFALFVRPAWRARANDKVPLIEGRISRLGFAAAVVLVGLSIWRLHAQAYSVFGLDGAVTWDHVTTIAFSTGWGHRWLWQFGAAFGATLLLAPTEFVRRNDKVLATLAAVMVVMVLPLTGHAVTREGTVTLSLMLQSLHVGAVGLWVGTLIVILTLAWPAGHGAFAAAIRAYSPLALGAVATLASTGFLTSIVYLDSFSELWSGVYGRTLVLKVCSFGAVAALGAYNWRRLKPVLDQPMSADRLKRSAAIELSLAGLTLAVTAVLVAMPLGHD